MYIRINEILLHNLGPHLQMSLNIHAIDKEKHCDAEARLAKFDYDQCFISFALRYSSTEI